MPRLFDQLTGTRLTTGGSVTTRFWQGIYSWLKRGLSRSKSSNERDLDETSFHDNPGTRAATDHNDHSVDSTSEAIQRLMIEQLDRIELSISSALDQRNTIGRLHEQLQEYRAGLIEKSIDPIVLGMIRVDDHIGDRLGVLEDQNEESGAGAGSGAVSELESIRQEIREVLKLYGIVVYINESDRFDPRNQIAVEMIPAPGPADVGLIVARRRSGFHYENDSKVMRPEQVSVYRERNGGDS